MNQDNEDPQDNAVNRTGLYRASVVSRSQLQLNLAHLLDKTKEHSVPVFIRNRKTLQHVLIPCNILPESISSWLEEKFEQVTCQSRLESGL